MIEDAQLLFSQAQALTSTGAADSTNVIDLGALRDLAVGDTDLYVYVFVTTAFTSGGSATLKVDFVTATDAAFTTPVIIQSSQTVPVASLAGGYPVLLSSIPFGTLRYLKLVYTVGTAAMTAGAVTSGITDNVQKVPFYRSGIDVSAI